jgi:ATP-dependent Clp protease ATP-binding subunit ClpC
MIEDPLSEDLLKGTFAGKDTITVRMHQVDGEKKLYFDATAGGAPQELVAAAGPGEAKP